MKQILPCQDYLGRPLLIREAGVASPASKFVPLMHFTSSFTNLFITLVYNSFGNNMVFSWIPKFYRLHVITTMIDHFSVQFIHFCLGTSGMFTWHRLCFGFNSATKLLQCSASCMPVHLGQSFAFEGGILRLQAIYQSEQKALLMLHRCA